MNWKTHWLFQNRSRLPLMVSSAILLVALIAFLSIYATLTADAVSIEAKPAAEGAAVSPVLTYQGRLLNPTTGAPQNGTHTFTFSLYNVDSGGAALWTEVKNLTVSGGLFSTLLGDTTALPASLFTGQNLWLGIKVGADPEATPRQRIAPVAYAMYADNADRLDAQDSAFFRNATNLNAGTVAEARIDAAIARDSEIKTLVLAFDGTGSGLDADLLDGQDSTAFAAASHAHDNRYFTEGESDGRFVNDNTGEVDSADLANAAVTSSKIANGAVGDAQIADRTRLLSFPAGALSFDPASTVIKAVFNGLDWQRNFASPAYLIITRPDDWDGTSSVSFTIHFYPTTNSGGNIDFFIRPRAYAVGNTFADAASINATPVAAAGTSVISKQTFTIPASSFGSRELWVISIQNQGSGSTYPDTVRVMAVSLSYTSVR